jgi:hypothetical protein
VTKAWNPADYPLEASPGYPFPNRLATSFGKFTGRLKMGLIGPSIISRCNVIRLVAQYSRSSTGLVTLSSIGTALQALPVGTKIRIACDPGPLVYTKDPYAIEGVFYITARDGTNLYYQDTRTTPIYDLARNLLPVNFDIQILTCQSMSSISTYLSMYSDGGIKVVANYSMSGTNTAYIVSHLEDLVNDSTIDVIFISGGSFGTSLTGAAAMTSDGVQRELLRIVGYAASTGKIVIVGTTPASLNVITATQYLYGRDFIWWQLKQLQTRYPGVYVMNEERPIVLPADSSGFMDNDYCIDGIVHWNSEGAKVEAWELYQTICHLVPKQNKCLGFSVKDNKFNTGVAGNTNIVRGWYNDAGQAISAGAGTFSGTIPLGARFTASNGSGVSSITAIANTLGGDADEWHMDGQAVSAGVTHRFDIFGVSNEISTSLTPGDWEAVLPVRLSVGKDVLTSVEVWFEATIDGTARIFSAALLNAASNADATKLKSGFAGPLYFPDFRIPAGATVTQAQFSILITFGGTGGYSIDIGGNGRLEIVRP